MMVVQTIINVSMDGLLVMESVTVPENSVWMTAKLAGLPVSLDTATGG
ncbi:MAG: hypothetical protein Q9M26_00900 [Mariprofundales bacterium]|nr:hypothetical protein [Mariprofundales bacterium]